MIDLFIQLSSSTNQDDEESGNESDEIDDEEKISKLSEMIKETLADPIEKVKNVASDIKNKVSYLIVLNLCSFSFFV